MRLDIQQHKFKIVCVLVLVLLLAMVRLLENVLFYDPFLPFFKEDFTNATLPNYLSLPLFFGLFFRYVLNAIFSLAILYVVFKDVSLLKLSSVLYVIFFVVLITLFFFILNFSEKPDYMLLFYIRRFLIQPLFLVIFLPAFYYQKKNS